jgi:HB1, ASXL, restriction endonuclease HTH domain
MATEISGHPAGSPLAAALQELEGEAEQLRADLQQVAQKTRRLNIVDRAIGDLRSVVQHEEMQPLAEEVAPSLSQPAPSRPLGSNHNQAGRSRPAYREAITQILNDSPAGAPLRPQEVVEEMRQRDWLSPTNENPVETIRTTMHTMVKKQQLVKTGEGAYALPGDRRPRRT